MTPVTLPNNELTEFDLPRVCVVTGSSQGVVFKDVKFSWYPRWTMVFVFVAWPIAVILALALTRRVKGQLPFTEAGYRTWRRAVMIRGLSIVGLIVLIVVAIVMMVGDSGALGGVTLLLALLAPILATTLTRKQVLSCTRIDEGQITLKLPSDEAAMAIRNRVHAGAGISVGKTAA